MDASILEICGFLGAVTAGVGGPIAVVRWALNGVKSSIVESETRLKTMLSDSEARSKSALENHAHKIANLGSTTDALDREHQKHIERTVRLESNLLNLEKGQERIEASLEKVTDILREMAVKQGA